MQSHPSHARTWPREFSTLLHQVAYPIRLGHCSDSDTTCLVTSDTPANHAVTVSSYGPKRFALPAPLSPRHFPFLQSLQQEPNVVHRASPPNTRGIGA
jgi:hypothetical protein